MIESHLCTIFESGRQDDGKPLVMGNSLPPDPFIYFRTALIIRKFFLKTNQIYYCTSFPFVGPQRTRPYDGSFRCLKTAVGLILILLLWDKHPGSSNWFSHTWISIHSPFLSLFSKICPLVLIIFVKANNHVPFVWLSQNREKWSHTLFCSKTATSYSNLQRVYSPVHSWYS